jgi:hypothetical protein
VRVPFRLGGRELLLVSDEDVGHLEGAQPYNAAFLWLVDITDERGLMCLIDRVRGLHILDRV